MRQPSRLCLVVLLFFVAFTGISQNKKQLENKKAKLQKEIQLNKALLKETSKSKKISLGQLVLVNKQIEARESLIATIKAQVRSIGRKIAENESLIQAMEEDLKNLKDEYAKMIVQAHKNRNAYDRLMFIFSADDFNQAYRRLKYYQQYTRYRQSQAELIKETQEVLNEKVAALQVTQSEKQSLLTNEKAERDTLSAEKQKSQLTLRQLQSKEKQLKKDINTMKAQYTKLNKAIEEAIRKEMAAKKAKKSLINSPEAKELAGNFIKNKGKLPWPAAQARITGRFGKQPHPVLRNIKVNNNGIDFTTKKGAKARAVFDGVVSKIIAIPGAGRAVLVRHGEFLSVYFKLKEVFVAPGDRIKTKQDVGAVMTDEVNQKTELHFEIWQGQQPIDPTIWLFQAK